MKTEDLKIKLIGSCGSGKTTLLGPLVTLLEEMGHHIHAVHPEGGMWDKESLKGHPQPRNFEPRNIIIVEAYED